MRNICIDWNETLSDSFQNFYFLFPFRLGLIFLPLNISEESNGNLNYKEFLFAASKHTGKYY
jgi:hypothetical protein